MLRPMTNEDCSLLAGRFHDHSINYTINTLCVTLHRERETEEEELVQEGAEVTARESCYTVATQQSVHCI